MVYTTIFIVFTTNDIYTTISIQWFLYNGFYTTVLYNDFYTTIPIQRLFADPTNDYVLLEENHIVGMDPQKSLYPGPVDEKSLAGDSLLPTVFGIYNDFLHC